ncbi:MAG: LemA family protein, partial [Armatimonadota bacterium]
MGVLTILLVLVLVLAAWAVVIYNRLVRLMMLADNAWSDVDVQLKRRHDLVPNLVETVKGYAAHERNTLEAVIQARNAALAAQNPEQRIEAENMLTNALRQIFALAEAYPDLKANQVGATSHRLGPVLHATLQTLHHELGLPVRRIGRVMDLLGGL